MKCIILADNSNISLFKRTVINNMPYCDKYIIICKDKNYNDINTVMGEIRDVSYDIFKTCHGEYSEDIKSAIKNIGEDEIILVVPCEITTDEKNYSCNDIIDYKRCIIAAIKEAMTGSTVRLSHKGTSTGIYCFKKKDCDKFTKVSSSKSNEDTDVIDIDIEICVNRHENDKSEISDFCVKLKPAFKDYLWGGIKLKEKYGKQCDLDIIAESWELSAHEAGESVIATGKYNGLGFREYLEKTGNDNLGWKCSDTGEFPVLIKFIDAKNPLSIQVHPDDQYALLNEDEYGKNEMWYILDCEEEAGIYCGFKQDTSAAEVKERIENNTILDILNWIPVKKGDVYFIKAGTVHAIGGGIMICEIQQSSNCTYRLYDYDRTDKNGNKRELHIQKALDVLDYKRYEPQNFEGSYVENDNFSSKLLAKCKYFKCESRQIHGVMPLTLDYSSFKSIICVTGEGIIRNRNEEIEFKPGDSLFLPKNNCTVEIEGNCEIVITEL